MTEGTAWRADDEFFVSFGQCSREQLGKRVLENCLFSLFSTYAYHKGGGKVFILCLVIFFYVATFFPWYPHLIIRYSNM